MFWYGFPPASSNRFGHNLVPTLICAPTTIYAECLAPALTYPLTTLDNIWFVANEPRSAKRRKHTHLLSKDFISKMNLSFIKRAPYSHFWRSLSSTFVVNEN